ncbi:c6 zinc finger domain-containing protein, partial [Pyrenophora tritici-repentis]
PIQQVHARFLHLHHIPRKKGPQGSRAKVLSELRETQRNTQLAAGFPTDFGYDGHSLPLTFARTQGLLPPALVESCIEYFFNNFYPTEPVLQRQRAQEAVVGMDRSTEAYCMIVALCAYIMIQGNHKPDVNVLPRQEMAHMSNVDIGHVLLEESVHVRQGYQYRENPTYMSVLTSYFYQGCYFGLARETTAWTYLREASTQAQLLGMHDGGTYKYDPLNKLSKRVLYWQLFIAESTALILQVQTQLSEAVPAYFERTEAQEVQIRTTQQWLRSSMWQLGVSQGLISNVNY